MQVSAGKTVFMLTRPPRGIWLLVEDRKVVLNLKVDWTKFAVHGKQPTEDQEDKKRPKKTISVIVPIARGGGNS